MNILLLGSGGRESALAWKIAQSPYCTALFIAPGNGGTAAFGKNIAIGVNDFDALKTCCLEKEIDLLVPGSEEPLVNGIYDYFKKDNALKDIIIAGPSAKGAQLEGSKAFAKQFMQRHHIPTAGSATFNEENFEAGLDYIAGHSLPVVLKADGLAAGKGVVITEDREEARKVFTDMIREASFGAAGKKVVIEQFLKGIELSVFVLTDGEHYVLLPEAKDYKRIGEQDSGPNTGGMGAVSPVPFAKGMFMEKVKEKIIGPTIKGLREEDITYQGFIFFGLINVDGDPFVIEYNCRMGDPETEVVIPRLGNDIVGLFLKMARKELDTVAINCKAGSAATVMLVSEGYPGKYEKDKIITGVEAVTGSLVFQAGTKEEEGELKTSGGRVMAVTSFGDSLEEALEQSYKNAEKIHFDGKYFRKDIGFEFLK
jgi:phosphoribosylamine--glycine ligase